MAKKKKCPICGKPEAADFMPFCSDRCRKVDLRRWMHEVYAIPTAEQVTDDAAEASDSSDQD